MNGDPLAQLRDIHLPEPVGWWPPAPGWWVLGVIVLVLAAVAARYLVRYISRGRFRREARRELSNLAGNQAGMDDRQLVEQLNILLRQVAIRAYGRETVSPLVGGRWLEFLNRKGDTDQFTAGPGQVLGDGHYRSEIKADAERLVPLVEKWLRRRHPC